MKKHKILLGFLIISSLGLSVFRIFVVNKITTDGVALAKIEEETAYYKTSNLMYKEKIFTLSSLSNVSSKAAKLGFIDSKLGFVLGRSVPIAQRP